MMHRNNNQSLKPGRGGRGSRERQSVWCCGITYQRWRFVWGEFPGTHHEQCVHCGRALAWPEARLTRTPSPAEKRERDREVWKESQRRRVDRFVRQGLTSKGQPRQRRASVSMQELAWRDFRSTLDIKLPELLTPLDR